MGARYARALTGMGVAENSQRERTNFFPPPQEEAYLFNKALQCNLTSRRLRYKYVCMCEHIILYSNLVNARGHYK